MLDIEGMELPALAAAASVLSSRPKLAIEFHVSSSTGPYPLTSDQIGQYVHLERYRMFLQHDDASWPVGAPGAFTLTSRAQLYALPRDREQ
jgi:hypothetical protein